MRKISRYTVEQLISELTVVAATSKKGLAAHVLIGDYEGNKGDAQFLRVIVDDSNDNVVIECDPDEHV